MNFDLLKFIEENGPKFLTIVIILFVGIVLIKFLTEFLKKALRKSKVEPTTHKFVESMTRVCLYIILLVILLETLDVKMGSMIAVISVAGLAISLAIQDTLSNVASGFIILLSKPFETGNYVEVNGIEGIVKHISILHTKLNTIDNKAIYIPNGLVSKNRIINFSREENRRLELFFSIGYDNDFTLAKNLIKKCIEENQFALTDPEPLVRVCEHGESAIKIMVRVWVKTESYLDLKFDLLEEVKLAFDKNNINIPYNHINVIVQNPK